MSNWFGRFAILTVVGALLCSALVVGCGGGGDEGGGDAENTTNTAP